MDKKILYVCTYWGVRSQIAELLTRALKTPGIIADSAGFETGVIGALPIQVMRERGLDLPAEAPPTLFHYARQADSYDYIVTLCNQQTQENYQVLYGIVGQLFRGETQVVNWNVPDFMLVAKLAPEERMAKATQIVDDIESQVIEFVRRISSPRNALAS
ncbi:MAG: hypothetical protein AB8B93_07715 [Pseudomonadales bacterium]